MKTYWDSSALIEAVEDRALRARIKPGDNATRSHTLSELFSTLTKGVNYRYSPADAAAVIADLRADMTFVDLTADEMVDAIKQASRQGVRGGQDPRSDARLGREKMASGCFANARCRRVLYAKGPGED